MHPRRGVTLTEVLIAIFLMAIGLLSLLALFPVGIVNILQASRDARAAKYAANAEAIAEFARIRSDPVVVATLDNANYGGLAITPDEPSVPVWVHPLDVLEPNVGGIPIGAVAPWAGIPRSSVGNPSIALAPNRWFEQSDELSFTKSGEGFYPTDQERTYSWCYVVRRPRMRDPEVVELTVVVFVNRKPAAAGPTGPVIGEVTLGGPVDAMTGAQGKIFTTGSTTATIAYTGDTPPAIKRGFWLFDATVGREPGPNRLLSNGYFYRVVDLSDPYPGAAGENLIDIQLLTPARADGYVCVLMTGTLDVIEKGVGRTPRR